MMRGSSFHQAFPASRVPSIDGVENKGNSLIELWGLRYAKRNSSVTNFIFRADEPLAHRRRRNEKRRCSSRGVNAKHSLQHQGSAGSRINRRMRTNKKKFQSLIG